MKTATTGFASLPVGYGAVVIGATGAIGDAVARRLEADPSAGDVLRFARSADRWIDVRDEASVAAAAADAAQTLGEIDVLFIATGGLTLEGRGPEKALSQVDPEALLTQMWTNAFGPLLVLKHFAPALRRRGRSLTAALSARVGSIGDNGLGGWYGYRAAKAALNQYLRTAAVEIRRRRPEAVVAALHPGTVASAVSQPFRPAGTAEPGVFAPDAAAAQLIATLDGLRPAQSGGFFDYAARPIAW